jgi:protein-disulfide isomerase
VKAAYLFFNCMLVLWAQAPAAGGKSALDKKTLEAYVRHLLLYPPHVQVEVGDSVESDIPGLLRVPVRASAGTVSEERVFLVSKDGSRVLDAKVYDINKSPFQREMDRLTTAGQPTLGTPGAPVSIVLFSDFQCSYCAQEGKSLRAELLKAFPTQVQLVFKDFPIAQIHPWAVSAAVAGRCVFSQKPALFWDYHDWAFNNQDQLTAENFNSKFNYWAGEKGLDVPRLNVCRNSPNAQSEVDRSMVEARSLGVNSTPTMFINGRKLGGYIPWDNLKQIIELEIGYQAAARKAADECCALPPLSPAKSQ